MVEHVHAILVDNIRRKYLYPPPPSKTKEANDILTRFTLSLYASFDQVHIGRYLARMIFAEHVRSADLFKEDDVVFE